MTGTAANAYWPKATESADRWTVQPIDIGAGDQIAYMTFLNENEGWACGQEFLYKTVDSGWTWTKMPISLLKGDVRIVKLLFSDRLHGWLVLQHGGAAFGMTNRIEVYRTLTGGRSWKLSHTEEQSTATDFAFLNGYGWLIGSRYVGDHPQQFLPVVSRFSERSGNWLDDAPPLLQTYKADVRQKENEDAGVDFAFISLEKVAISPIGCIVLVTAEQSVIRSCDSGASWTLVDFHGKAGYRRTIIQVGAADDSVRVLESIGGVEGTGSRLVSISNKDVQNPRIFQLGPYFLFGGYFISDQEILVAGQSEQRSAEVVLRTEDGGYSWAEVYSEPIGNSASFYFASPNVLWSVDSTIKRISRK